MALHSQRQLYWPQAWLRLGHRKTAAVMVRAHISSRTKRVVAHLQVCPCCQQQAGRHQARNDESLHLEPPAVGAGAVTLITGAVTRTSPAWANVN